ncbi:hypothetical protein LTR94_031369, partial [Friedmanniomyces endolithicus]
GGRGPTDPHLRRRRRRSGRHRLRPHQGRDRTTGRGQRAGLADPAAVAGGGPGGLRRHGPDPRAGGLSAVFARRRRRPDLPSDPPGRSHRRRRRRRSPAPRRPVAPDPGHAGAGGGHHGRDGAPLSRVAGLEAGAGRSHSPRPGRARPGDRRSSGTTGLVFADPHHRHAPDGSRRRRSRQRLGRAAG